MPLSGEAFGEDHPAAQTDERRDELNMQAARTYELLRQRQAALDLGAKGLSETGSLPGPAVVASRQPLRDNGPDN